MLSRSVLSLEKVRFLCTTSVKCALSEAAIKKQDYYKNINQTQGVENTKEKPVGWEDAKPYESIPGPKPLPLIGNFFRFLPMGKFHGLDLLQIAERLQKEYGDIVSIKNMAGNRRDFVFLYNPDYIETLYRNDSIWPERKGADGFDYYRKNVRNDVFGDSVGVVISQGQEWFNARTIINPILMQPRSTEIYVDKISQVATELIENMRYFAQNNPQGEMPEDFANELNKWSLESIGVVALNTKLGCLKRNLDPQSEEQVFINNVMEFFDLFIKIEILPNLWRVYSTPTWKRYVKVLDHLTFAILKYAEKATLEDQTGLDERDLSMIQRLVKIDKKIAIAMAIDMLQAGVDTTSKSLATVLYYLAKHPQIQEKARKEAKSLLPNKNSPVTKETLKNDTYLKAVIKETTRIAAVVPINIRTLQKDQVLGGYQIPKGTQIFAEHLLISRSEKYFTRAQEFIPERWLRTSTDELSPKNIHPFASLPFGFGQRACVGKRIAMMELETGLLKILRNFEVSWPHEDAVFKTNTLHGITSPLKFHMKEVKT